MPAVPQTDHLKIAIGAIVIGCFALSLGAALIKQQSISLVLWQIFVVRSAILIPLLVNFVRRYGHANSIMPRQSGWTPLRSMVLVIMWAFYFATLPHIEFAVAAAAFYTLPIFIACTPIRPEERRTMGILATAILAGSVGAAVAYQKGPASLVSIFEFSFVGFAVVWGYLLFAEVPAPLVIPGILMIITAGMMVSRQHRR